MLQKGYNKLTILKKELILCKTILLQQIRDATFYMIL